MHAPKVEIALGRHIGDVGGDLALLAELPYLRRRLGVVHGGHDHVRAIEVGGLEFPVDVLHLALGNAVGYFGVEAVAWGDDGHFGVGVEDVEDAACGDLRFSQFACGAWGHWY